MNIKDDEVKIEHSVIKNNSILIPLLGHKIKNYFMLMRAFLLQYKQGLILLLALLVPTFSSLNYIFVKPFFVFITSYNLVDTLASSFLIYFIYSVWIIVQKHAIYSYPIDSYIETLPILKSTKFTIDLCMIIIANNIFLMPLIVVLVRIFFLNHFDFLNALSVIFLYASIFALQKNVLTKNYLSCLMIISLNISYCFFKIVLSYSLFLAISMLSIASIFYIFSSDKMIDRIKKSSVFSLKWIPLSPRVALLLRASKTQVILRLSIIAIILGLFFGISFLPKLNFFSLKIILISQGIITFVASGMFIYFERENKKFKIYLSSLPISRSSHIIGDVFCVEIILLVFNALFITGMMHYFSIQFSSIVFIQVYQFFLLTILYFIRRHFEVFGTFLSSVFTVLWIYFPFFIKGFL